MTALRVINLLIWSGLFFYMLPGAWAALRGREVHRGDPMRLSVAMVSLVIIFGNLRFLFAADNEDLFAAIYVLCAAIGLYKFRLAHLYGRGPLV